MVVGVIYLGAVEGWQSAMAPAMFLVAVQIAMLYALRQLFLCVSETQRRERYVAEGMAGRETHGSSAV
ncbi:hypothetical protein BWI17_03925 [Betaproteobacteria bacterium GR16-43]|nr:hypothetical protein BWI17_03925 [Betaproteobacteria bacterium GR16-43]